jgi:predicted DNA-binding transcriptional regulator AlpA
MVEHKYLKLDEVVAMLKVSRNWFYKTRKAGKFVKPAIERPMRWRLDQINDFLDGVAEKKTTYRKS